jgi:hypothetical protein
MFNFKDLAKMVKKPSRKEVKSIKAWHTREAKFAWFEI